MVPIFDALAQNSSVTSFTICDNSTEGWGRALQELLERNTTLQSLRMLRLLHKLAASAQLQQRRSTECNLDRSQIAALAQGMKSNTTLKEIVLRLQHAHTQTRQTNKEKQAIHLQVKTGENAFTFNQLYSMLPSLRHLRCLKIYSLGSLTARTKRQVVSLLHWVEQQTCCGRAFTQQQKFIPCRSLSTWNCG